MINQPNYKYYTIIACLFVAVLIISNVASSKITHIGNFIFDAGTILFPLSYIFDDILTEVYGYSGSRKIIWIGFICLILMSAIFKVVGLMPPADFWAVNQPAYDLILGVVPRIVLGSLTAYWLGEFLNSYVLAKLKIFTKGKYLWTRTIGSTIVGEAVDSVVFSFIAFYGTLDMTIGNLWNLIFTIYVFKVLFEILATPLTYKIINFLKRAEGVDVYDNKTNFNPFIIKDN